MAWHSKIALPFTALVSTLILAGCNVGKTDTVTTTSAGTTASTTASTNNDGIYSGGFTSPVKLLCEDWPGRNPQVHGECGQLYTLEGYVGFSVSGNTLIGGSVSVYGYDRELSAASAIDAYGDFTYSFEHINGRGNLKNSVMTGVVWEGPYEWKYGEFTFSKQ